LEVLAKSPQDFFPLAIAHLAAEFTQREVHDVVMMQFFRGDFTTEFQPDAMQEIDFLRSQARRMGTQIDDMFPAVGRVDFEGQVRLGVRQVFPSQARAAGFFAGHGQRGVTES
jgi:hypothetical protein